MDKALRQEFTISPIPREFATVNAACTLPQRKIKGKAKARTVTSMEAAERRSKRPRPLQSHLPSPIQTSELGQPRRSRHGN